MGNSSSGTSRGTNLCLRRREPPDSSGRLLTLISLSSIGHLYRLSASGGRKSPPTAHHHKTPESTAPAASPPSNPRNVPGTPHLRDARAEILPSLTPRTSATSSISATISA